MGVCKAASAAIGWAVTSQFSWALVLEYLRSHYDYKQTLWTVAFYSALPFVLALGYLAHVTCGRGVSLLTLLGYVATSLWSAIFHASFMFALSKMEAVAVVMAVLLDPLFMVML